MDSSTFWRPLAIVTSIGWATTVVAWMTSPSDDLPANVAAVARARPPGIETRAFRPPEARELAVAAARDGEPGLDAIRDSVRSEVLDEIEQERAARRQQRSEQHLGRLLDDVVEFTDEHGLDSDTRAALEASMVTLHETLEAHRPSGPPEPGGPPAEVLEVLVTSFDQFRDEVDEVIDDPELADAFTEQMTPRPLRDRQRDLTRADVP